MTVGVSGSGNSGQAQFAQRREKRFKKLDANGDGMLDQSELDAAAKKHGSTGADLVKKLDTNGDGVVDQAEFSAASGKIEDRMHKFFDKLKAGGTIGSEEDAHLLMDLLQKAKESGKEGDQSSTALLDKFLAQLKEHAQESYNQNGDNGTQNSASLFSTLV